MRLVLAFVFSAFFSVVAVAQHSHGAKGPNGGDVQDVAGVEVELVTAGNNITLYVTGENHKPIAIKGFNASAMIVTAGGQEPVALEGASENSFKGTAKAAIAPGATVVVMLKTAAGKSGQVRFKK